MNVYQKEMRTFVVSLSKSCEKKIAYNLTTELVGFWL